MEGLGDVGDWDLVVGADRFHGLSSLNPRAHGRQWGTPRYEQRVTARYVGHDPKQRSLRDGQDQFRGPMIAEGDSRQVLLDDLVKDALARTDHSQQTQLEVVLAGRVVEQDIGAVAEELPGSQRVFEFSLVDQYFQRSADSLQGKTGLPERLHDSGFDEADEWNCSLIPVGASKGGDDWALLHDSAT
jgi:hypothetical protein